MLEIAQPVKLSCVRCPRGFRGSVPFELIATLTEMLQRSESHLGTLDIGRRQRWPPPRTLEHRVQRHLEEAGRCVYGVVEERQRQRRKLGGAKLMSR